MISESKIQSQIIKELEKQGFYSVKLIKTSVNGIPDLIAVKENRCIFIEVKTEKGVLSELQKYRAKELIDRNIEYYLMRSLEDVKKIINKTLAQ